MKWMLFSALLVASTSQAGTLKMLFKNDKAPKAYRYVGVYNHAKNNDEYVVAFGDALNYRVYDTTGFYTYEGAQVSGKEEETSFSSTSLKRDQLIKVKFADLKGKTIFTGNYEKYNSDSSTKFAANIDKVVEADFSKYRKMSDPATTTELRRMFRQINIDFGYGAEANDGSLDYPFPTFDLQIESNISTDTPKAALAKATIKKDGSDAISKMFLKNGSKFYNSYYDALSAAEKYYSTDYEEDSKDEYVSYSKTIKYEGLSPRLEKAISKFLKVEVLDVDAFNCEDSVYTWTSATWILKDGSTVSYHPYTECD